MAGGCAGCEIDGVPSEQSAEVGGGGGRWWEEEAEGGRTIEKKKKGGGEDRRCASGDTGESRRSRFAEVAGEPVAAGESRGWAARVCKVRSGAEAKHGKQKNLCQAPGSGQAREASQRLHNLSRGIINYAGRAGSRRPNHFRLDGINQTSTSLINADPGGTPPPFRFSHSAGLV